MEMHKSQTRAVAVALRTCVRENEHEKPRMWRQMRNQDGGVVVAVVFVVLPFSASVADVVIACLL